MKTVVIISDLMLVFVICVTTGCSSEATWVDVSDGNLSMHIRRIGSGEAPHAEASAVYTSWALFDQGTLIYIQGSSIYLAVLNPQPGSVLKSFPVPDDNTPITVKSDSYSGLVLAGVVGELGLRVILKASVYRDRALSDEPHAAGPQPSIYGGFIGYIYGIGTVKGVLHGSQHRPEQKRGP